MERIPRVGMRMVKTSFAVAICFLIYVLRGRQGDPVLSSVAAIICMQPLVENSVNVARNRIFSTLLGASFGLVVILIIGRIPESVENLKFLVIAVSVLPVLYTTVLLQQPGTSALTCIVFLSVAMSSGSLSPLQNGVNRSIETIIGVLVSLAVNMAHLPRRKENDLLFISGFDEALYDDKSGVTPYCVFEMNQLLRDGLSFTIATERTPASLIAKLSGLNLKLPIIAMDGAVLYDVTEKRYLACQGISDAMCETIVGLLSQMDLHYFLNVVWQDVLLIFYKDFKNDEEKKLYEEARRSPHRNYVYGARPEDGVVVYVLLVLEDNVADEVEARLMEVDEDGELLFIREKSETPEDYCHFKIYHKNATKEYMMYKLLENIKQKKIVVFGSNENDLPMMAAADLSYTTSKAEPEVVKVADYQLKGLSGDSIVREIFHLYEPLRWKKLPKELRKETGKGKEGEQA